MSLQPTPPAPDAPASSEPTTAEAPSWTESFSPDSRSWIEQQGFKDPDSIVNSYRNLRKQHSIPKERLLELPEKPDDAAAWDPVYARLGRPEKPEGYEIEPFTFEGGEQITGAFKEAAHRAGLSQRQLADLTQWYSGLYESGTQAAEEQRAQQAQVDEMTLKREWGTEYQTNIDSGKRAVKWLGVDEPTLEKLEQSVGTAALYKMMARIGRGLGEHQQPTGETREGAGGFGMTPGAAKARRLELFGPDSEGQKKISAGDRAAIAENRRLSIIEAQGEEMGGPPPYMRP